MAYRRRAASASRRRSTRSAGRSYNRRVGRSAQRNVRRGRRTGSRSAVARVQHLKITIEQPGSAGLARPDVPTQTETKPRKAKF